ncbi:MAG: protease modulator HflK [Verrucomicrobiota bacterium]
MTQPPAAPLRPPPAESPALAALRSSIVFLRWGLALLVLVYLTSGVTIVGSDERALVLRLGKLQPEVHGPGLLLALPRPIDEVIRVPATRVQVVELDTWTAPPPVDSGFEALETATLHPVYNGYILTGDRNIIHARFNVRYRVADPAAYALGTRDRDALLRLALQTGATAALQTVGVDDALGRGQDELRRRCLAEAKAEVERLGLGVELLRWEIAELTPARQVLASFQEVVSAQVEARTLLEDAASYASAQRQQGEARAYRLTQSAEADAARLLARAKGETTAFTALLESYRLDPGGTRTRLFLETIETILPRLQINTVAPASGVPVRVWLGPRDTAEPLAP